MNRKELERIRKENQSKVNLYKLSHKFGCVRVNCKNSLRHEIAKLVDVYVALKNGHKVATECISKDGKRRFDFIDFDTGEIKEYETNGSDKMKCPKCGSSRIIDFRDSWGKRRIFCKECWCAIKGYGD